MMRILLLILSISFAQSVQSQVSDWENYNIEQNGFIKDAMLESNFTSGGVVLDNEYIDDPIFPYWVGWILSAGTDIDTPGTPNEHSSITGAGADGSDNYAVTFIGEESIIKYDDYTAPRKFISLSISNNTYAYKSMLEGDQFAKRFGGEDGNDKDFFILTIKGYKNGVYMTDSIDFVLAVYRFDNNDEDYIFQSWETIDLGIIAEADSIGLKMFSSDNSSFGMNTPAYLCVDNITWQMASPIVDIEPTKFSIQSNVVSNSILLNVSDDISFKIYNCDGQVVKSDYLTSGINDVNITELISGMYFIKITDQRTPAKQFSVIK